MFNYSKSKEYLINVSNKLDNSETICKQMLELLKNKTTKVILDNDIKNSYYVFLNDTIYLSNKEKNRTNYRRICTVAHECIHSKQNKIMQIINFVFSNIELISFIMGIILILLKTKIDLIVYYYLCITIVSVIPRLILEIDAVIKSLILTKEYLKTIFKTEETENITNLYRIQIIVMSPLFILALILGRIIRIAIMYSLIFIN